MTTITLLLASLLGADVSSRGVLLDFSASWCMPCQQMSPIVSRLEREGLPIRKIDLDQQRSLAEEYGITSIPAFVLVIDGRIVDRRVGITSESELREMLSRIPPPAQLARSKAAAPARSQPLPVSRTRAPREDNAEATLADAGTAAPKKTSGGLLGFQLPFTKKQPVQTASAPKTETAVIRAKYDNDRPLQQLADEDPILAASVRIRVRDESGINYGSGTIIDSRPGHTVILTCGHILRELSKMARIEVDVFIGDRHETFLADVIDYELKADVGLISIPTAAELTACRLATPRTTVGVDELVASVGCGGGEVPTRQSIRVTALNRYLGPDNIECSGVPIRGRSGGGLFNQQGEVIGVCIAADTKDRRGLYAGVKSVRLMLDRQGMDRVYRSTTPAEAIEAPIAATTPLESAVETVSLTDDAPPIEQLLTQSTEASTAAASLRSDDPVNNLNARLADVQDSVLHANQSNVDFDELKQYTQNAEVICIIRPVNQPESASRVVIINRASSKFLSYLADESGAPAEQRPTEASTPTVQTVEAERRDFSGDHEAKRVAREGISLTSGQGPRRYQRSVR